MKRVKEELAQINTELFFTSRYSKEGFTRVYTMPLDRCIIWVSVSDRISPSIIHNLQRSVLTAVLIHVSLVEEDRRILCRWTDDNFRCSHHPLSSALT